MTFEDKIKIAREILGGRGQITNIIRPVKDGEHADGGFRVTTKGDEFAQWVAADKSWDLTGWLLERLPEWEDFYNFLTWLKVDMDKEDEWANMSPEITMVHLFKLLTSPSILPEKVGEYIKWRDEK